MRQDILSDIETTPALARSFLHVHEGNRYSSSHLDISSKYFINHYLLFSRTMILTSKGIINDSRGSLDNFMTRKHHVCSRLYQCLWRMHFVRFMVVGPVFQNNTKENVDSLLWQGWPDCFTELEICESFFKWLGTYLDSNITSNFYLYRSYVFVVVLLILISLWCFCSWAFIANITLNLLPWTSFV